MPSSYCELQRSRIVSSRYTGIWICFAVQGMQVQRAVQAALIDRASHQQQAVHVDGYNDSATTRAAAAARCNDSGPAHLPAAELSKLLKKYSEEARHRADAAAHQCRWKNLRLWSCRQCSCAGSHNASSGVASDDMPPGLLTWMRACSSHAWYSIMTALRPDWPMRQAKQRGVPTGISTPPLDSVPASTAQKEHKLIQQAWNVYLSAGKHATSTIAARRIPEQGGACWPTLRLFKVLVHAPPGTHARPGSPFHGCLVPQGVDTRGAYAQHALAQVRNDLHTDRIAHACSFIVLIWKQCTDSQNALRLQPDS